jgi:hypothetical protein
LLILTSVTHRHFDVYAASIVTLLCIYDLDKNWGKNGGGVSHKNFACHAHLFQQEEGEGDIHPPPKILTSIFTLLEIKFEPIDNLGSIDKKQLIR